MNPKKRTPASKKKKFIKFDFDVDQTLLKNRQIFDLYDSIDEDSAKKTIKKLYALDTINHNPIHLYINSGGGCCSSGMAIINAMKTVKSPVVTIIEEVCSMGGHISVAGDKRVCYESSVWMAHDAQGDAEDYFQKMIARADFCKKYYDKVLEKNLRDHTKLTESDLKKAKNQELWLFPDDMLKKGVVDEIIINESKT